MGNPLYQAAGLLKTVTGEAVAIATGVPDLPREEADRRLSICNGCTYFKAPNCTDCGCNMLRKTLWRAATCPKGKW